MPPSLPRVSDRRLSLVVALALAASAACDCDGGNLGQLQPLIAADVGRVVFADTFVGARRSQTVRLSNPGTALLRVREMRIDGDGAFAGAGTAPLNIEVGNDVDVEVVFAPVVVGAASARLIVDSTADNQAALIVDLAGVGLAPLDCDDDNACTDERFDLDEGVCIRGFGSGACDDGSACTFNDRCDQGSCVGDAVVCADDVACTIDACDAARGCVFLPDNGACADDDPCSRDLCGVAGCENPPASDGTPCGRISNCDVIDLCVAAVCVAVDIPDGAPCNDGNVCTTDDVCGGGLCVGGDVVEAPTLLGESHRLLKTRGALVVGDRLLLADQLLRVVPLAPPLFAPAASVPAVAAETPHVAFDSASVDVVLYPTPGGFAALTRLPPVGPDLGTSTLASYVFDGDDIRPVSTLNVGPLFVGAFSALTENVLVTCGETPLAIESGVDGTPLSILPLPERPAVPQQLGASDFICAGGRTDNNLALEVAVARGVNDVLLVRDLDNGAAVVGTAPLPFPLTTARGWAVHGDRGFVVNSDRSTLLVDLSDVAAPVVVDFAPAPPLQVDMLVGHLALAHNVSGFSLVDISDVAAPVVLDWHVGTTSRSAGLKVLAAAADNAVLAVGDEIWRVGLSARGEVVPVVLQGRGGMARLIGEGVRLFGASRSQLSIVDATDVDSALRTDLPIASFSLPGPSLVGRFAAPLELFSPLLVDETIALGGLEAGVVFDRSHDLRASLDSVLDPTISSAVAVLSDDGALQVSFGVGIGFIEGAGAYLAAVTTSSCTGAAVTERPDCIDDSCRPNDGVCDGVIDGLADLDCASPAVVTFSSCGGGLAPVAQVAVAAFDFVSREELREARSIAHGDFITFFAADTAVLVDVSDAFAPVVVGVAFEPAFRTAAHVSAGFDADVWVIATTTPQAPPQAFFYDLHREILPDGEAILRATLSLAGASGAGSIRYRVLGVRAPRAWFSVWDPGESFQRGHSIVGVTLFGVPEVVERFPLTSEAVDMVIDDDKLVIGRVDGISVVSPPCGL